MKLVEFNSENTINNRVSSILPGFSVNAKVGLFNFNKPAIDLMGLKDKDQIVIHHDEEAAGCFYLEKVNRNGFSVRAKDDVTKGLLFNSTALAQKIFSILEIDRGGGTNRINGLIAGKVTELKGRKLWGLLIKPIV